MAGHREGGGYPGASRIHKARIIVCDPIAPLGNATFLIDTLIYNKSPNEYVPIYYKTGCISQVFIFQFHPVFYN
jgi:hypothetical protein